MRTPSIHPASAMALIATPIVWLAAEAFSPRLESAPAAQLAVIAAHPDRWYMYTLLLTVGSIVGVPAGIALLQLAAARMPRLGRLAGILVTLAFITSVADSAAQFWAWQMVRGGADRGQMAALQDRYDNAAGVSILFAVTGIGLLIGSILMAIVLTRSPQVATWSAIVFPLGVFANVFGFAANSIPGLIASCVLLLASMGSIGLAALRYTEASATAVEISQPVTA